MFKRLSLILLAGLFFSSVFADAEINIVGEVRDSISGDPLSGVIVQLTNSDLADTTDEEGNFHIDASTSVFWQPANNSQNASLQIIGANMLQWHCPAPNEVAVEVITLQGRKAATVFNGHVGPGLVSFAPPSLSSGVYFYRLITPEAHYTVPFMVTDFNHRISNEQKPSLQDNRYITKTSQNFSEKLFATKSGYFVNVAEVSDPQAQNVTIKILSLEDSPKMVEIPAANQTFTMGSSRTSERPTRMVSFQFDFQISKTTVTQGEYSELMGVNPSYYSDDLNRPVENVTWFDAALYCNELSKAEGINDTVYSYSSKITNGNSVTALEGLIIHYYSAGYRLPTEAEWEFACRGTTSTENYWGDENSEEYAWFDMNSQDMTHPVGQKLPNDYGLYDMAGNVWEWCNDWHERYNGFDETDPIGPLIGTYRIRRGNSWDSLEEDLRATYRSYNTPNTARNTTGFRVVLPMRD